jgi:hypothetical protein
MAGPAPASLLAWSWAGMGGDVRDSSHLSPCRRRRLPSGGERRRLGSWSSTCSSCRPSRRPRRRRRSGAWLACRVCLSEAEPRFRGCKRRHGMSLARESCTRAVGALGPCSTAAARTEAGMRQRCLVTRGPVLLCAPGRSRRTRTSGASKRSSWAGAARRCPSAWASRYSYELTGGTDPRKSAQRPRASLASCTALWCA